MRRSLILLSLATTALVVVALIVPLGLLVRRQAADNAKVDAERKAQATAALVALALAVDTDPGAVEAAIGSPPEGTVVILSDGTVLGVAQPSQGSLADRAKAFGATVAADVDAGWELALPVLAGGETAVVDVFVPDVVLTRGVDRAWGLLALLGVVLIAAAVLVADRLGQRLVASVRDLADAAHRLAEGDLGARVAATEPSEVGEVGDAFNYLAGRLDQLLAEERESVADLSHRLRTPLTALRLQAESLRDEGERSSIIGMTDRLERSVTRLIELARAPVTAVDGSCEVNEVVAARLDFWGLLAAEEGRDLEVDLAEESSEVALRADQLGAIVDTLVENVFLHTDRGSPLRVSAGRDDSRAWIEVADRGPGFGAAAVERGMSRGGSTGLGLDIVRKTAGSVGGGLETHDRPGGGAVVRVWLG